MSEENKEIDSIGRDIIDQVEATRPIWSHTKYRDRIVKSLQDLDTAWLIRLATPFHETVKELNRLVYRAFCEEFISAKKAVKIRIETSNIEFWLVPSPKVAKDLRTSIPCITGTEFIELLENPPDTKTLKLILSAKKNLSVKIEPKHS